MEAAKKFGKPIIAVKPDGQNRVPRLISADDDEVCWRTDSIINAIKKYTGNKSAPPVFTAMSYLGAESQSFHRMI